MSLKERILDELNKRKGEDISGQFLAEKFGVSRNAVWKAVKALKDSCYDITSVTNTGYCLSSKNDVISVDEIKKQLHNKELPIYYYEVIDSTNAEAKRLLLTDNNNEQFLVIANEQTCGHGRLGRSFYSPKSKGIYFTIVTSPKASIENTVSLTSYTAVCVASAVRELTGKDALIKWVNDIYIDDKKICGILTEAVSDFETGNVNYVLTGIGINIVDNDFPQEIKEKAGCINSNVPLKNELTAAIVNKLLDYKNNKTDFIEEYRKLSLVTGKEILYCKNNQTFSGKAIDIDCNGGLIIENEHGTETLTSGEISLKLK